MKKRIIFTAVGVTLAVILGVWSWFTVNAKPQSRGKGVRYETTKVLKNKGNVQMIAHRGLSGILLENTVPAFELAGQKSYYGIETDVHVTKDGQFIIVHDDDLKRIAGLDLCIEETDFDTLRALRFKDVYGDSEEKNMYLPSLDEYLAICIKYDKQAILELKNEMEPHQVLGIAKAVEDSGWFDRTTFISFSGENLLALREGYPYANAQFLVEDATEEEIQFMIDHHLDADVYWASVTKDLVERLHNEGLKVNCWTVDEKEDARMLKKCGVDYITSNILE
jgi:glycerophosphoryl diester phosphodiesterase